MADEKRLPRRLDTIRDRAQEHEDELESRRWWTPQKLADRWDVAVSTVTAIPFEQLRYKEFGSGKKLKRRRYKPEWVQAFEDSDNLPRKRAAGE